MKQWMKVAVGGCALLLAQQVLAADAMLYGPAAPANAGFFRVMNAGNSAVNVTFNGKVTPVAAGSSSGYAFSSPGQYAVSLGSVSQTLTLSQGSQQTLLWLDNKVTSLAETPFRDKTRAHLSVYNLSGAPVSLLTANGKSVLGPVANAAFAGRDVNALQMAFQITGSNSQVLQSTEPLVLKRGQVTSLFVLPGSPTRIFVAETAQ